ncbi:MAG: hypothetical protein H6755_05635 [Candidatus Omnitrophica bacterium]|nr:hypothetical protein [Candidatus Omnitrophota bacterium]MCB9747874.1 hypothetical protein [Candidatus Omnitrophota bacterium]
MKTYPFIICNFVIIFLFSVATDVLAIEASYYTRVKFKEATGRAWYSVSEKEQKEFLKKIKGENVEKAAKREKKIKDTKRKEDAKERARKKEEFKKRKEKRLEVMKKKRKKKKEIQEKKAKERRRKEREKELSDMKKEFRRLHKEAQRRRR